MAFIGGLSCWPGAVEWSDYHLGYANHHHISGLQSRQQLRSAQHVPLGWAVHGGSPYVTATTSVQPCPSYGLNHVCRKLWVIWEKHMWLNWDLDNELRWIESPLLQSSMTMGTHNQGMYFCIFFFAWVMVLAWSRPVLQRLLLPETPTGSRPGPYFIWVFWYVEMRKSQDKNWSLEKLEFLAILGEMICQSSTLLCLFTRGCGFQLWTKLHCTKL